MSKKKCLLQSIKIITSDGTPIDACLFEPKNEKKAAIILNSAVGIIKEYYHNFAVFLAEHGYCVLTYDYRGIGGSKPKSLRGFDATLQDWGRQDMASALEWLNQHYPTLPKHAIGHSIGGQLIGLLPNHQLLDQIIMIASSTGHWRWLGRPFRYVMFLLWFIYVPICTKIFGYAPVKKLGVSEDLPKNVVLEWRSWSLQPDYFAAFFDTTLKQHYFTDIKTPIIAYSFTDDAITNEKTVTSLLQQYTHAPNKHIWINPTDVHLNAIGHVGYFRSYVGKQLWPELLAQLSSNQKTI